jgi:hypothetical protein
LNGSLPKLPGGSRALELSFKRHLAQITGERKLLQDGSRRFREHLDHFVERYARC